MSSTESQSPRKNTFPGLFVRLVWFFAGPAALMFLAFELIRRGSFSAVDVAFGVVVGLIAIARYIDVTRYDGTTGAGVPMTRGALSRYMGQLVLFATIGWASAHGLGRYVLD